MDLKDWRKSKGLTQGELADKIGALPNTYQAYESARIGIPPDIQAKIRKMGYKGPWPEIGGEVTRADLESLRSEVRTQAAWIREELRKDIEAAVAGIQASLSQGAEQ